MLIIIKISGNNNKFYYIQLLEKDDNKPNAYAVFCRWGRVGETGASQYKMQDTSLHVAMSTFDKVMKSKSGKFWADRANAKGGSGKYAYLVSFLACWRDISLMFLRRETTKTTIPMMKGQLVLPKSRRRRSKRSQILRYPNRFKT